MKLTLRELRILSRLTCYEDALELTLNEIDHDEREEYFNNIENLRVTIAEWFFNYLSEKIFKKDCNGKTIYFFLESCEDLYEDEFEEVINKVKFSSEEEFYENISELFKENNYDEDEDYFDYFDDKCEEKE